MAGASHGDAGLVPHQDGVRLRSPVRHKAQGAQRNRWLDQVKRDLTEIGCLHGWRLQPGTKGKMNYDSFIYSLLGFLLVLFS